MTATLAHATIIDRIAIIVRDRVIKDSDIERDIRVVSFLNRQKLDFGESSRRAAANRLIDQAIIQREIQVGEYQVPSEEEVTKLLTQIQQDRAYTPAIFRRELAEYGLDEQQLRRYLMWQLTVLRFIDQRFRPGVFLADDELEQYYREHQAQFNQPLEQAKDQVRETLTGERINQQFENWIAARRKTTPIQYKEEALK